MGQQGGQKRRFRVYAHTYGQHPARGETTWGGPCQKVEIEEVDVRPSGAKGSEKNDPEDPDVWEAEISKAGRDGAFVFSDGSLTPAGLVVAMVTLVAKATSRADT